MAVDIHPYTTSHIHMYINLPLQEIYDTVGYTPVHLEKMASRSSSQALASASSSKFGRASPARAPSRLQPSPLVRHHKDHAHNSPTDHCTYVYVGGVYNILQSHGNVLHIYVYSCSVYTRDEIIATFLLATFERYAERRAPKVSV